MKLSVALIPSWMVLVSILVSPRSSGGAVTGDNSPGVPCVPVVSTFPRSSDRALHKELLRLAAESLEGQGIDFPLLVTLGDPEVDAKLQEILRGRKPSAMIFLDSSAYFLLSGGYKTPSFCFLPSAELIREDHDGPTDDRDEPILIETHPVASNVVGVLRRLTPSPRQLGIVYTVNIPWNDRFLNDLRHSDLPILERMSPLLRCALDPGACRNLTDVRYAVEHDLAELTTGSLVLVLPDVNTLKFSYCFIQYAETRGLGIIGLGDFSPDGSLVTIRQSPEKLARACFPAVWSVAFGRGPEEVSVTLPPPEVKFNAQRLKALGYRLAPDAEGAAHAR